MKRVACLSTLQAVPKGGSADAQIIDIFNSTRMYNIEHQISGAFVFRENHLLMIIEGESTHLANIIFKFRSDNRLKDFNMLAKEHIDAPAFTSWGVKILKQDGEHQDRILEKIHAIFKHDAENLMRTDARLSAFMQAAIEEAPAKTVQQEAITDEPPVAQTFEEPEPSAVMDFTQAMLSLSGWPKPGTLKMNPELMKICALLVGRPRRYNDLLQVRAVSSTQSLQNHLNKLHSLGILKHHPIDGKPHLVSIEGALSKDATKKSTDRFSAVLKNFLSASKF